MYYENKPSSINVINMGIVTETAARTLPFIITAVQFGFVADDKQGDGKNCAGYFCEIASQILAHGVQDKN
jgi:hypothetical protein